MILSLGEILYDMFPDGRRLGGAPFNFAYHLKKLGYPVRFVSRVGQDEAGESILSHLETHGFLREDVGVDPGHDTGWVRVTLDPQGSPTFLITPDVAYDYLFSGTRAAAAMEQGPLLVYFGSLLQRTESARRQLHALLDRRPAGTRLFYDMNLREGCRTAGIIAPSLARTDILKLSDEELVLTGKLLGLSGSEALLAETLMERFGLSVIALTRGAEGSVLYMNGTRLAAPPGPDIAVADTVGAGDAYASILAAGILDGWPPERIVREAGRFSARICTISGAVPERDSFYDHFRRRDA